MDLKSEVDTWLKSALAEEQLLTYSATIEGNSEKGDGYLGDILFVRLVGKIAGGLEKNYNLVLKCGKRSQALRNTNPVRDVFENEISMYKTVFPAFEKFQRQKGLQEPFDSLPKYYGYFKSDNMEVIALENLKKNEYGLWNRRQPMTRKHINMIMEEYGKWHAISAAMADQEPEKYQELTESLVELWKKFQEVSDFEAMYGNVIDEVYDVLKDDFDDKSMNDWKQFKSQIFYIFGEMLEENCFKVITHGDCWNNNFMFQNKDGVPSKLAILDWQMARVGSPVFDLSYFLFSCISESDIKNVDDILKIYHASFSSYLKKLGSDPDQIFPLSQLLRDWKKFARFGLLIGCFLVKICLLEKEEVPDIVTSAERGETLIDAFTVPPNDSKKYKVRVKYLVDYALKQGITD